MLAGSATIEGRTRSKTGTREMMGKGGEACHELAEWVYPSMASLIEA